MIILIHVYPRCPYCGGELSVTSSPGRENAWGVCGDCRGEFVFPVCTADDHNTVVVSTMTVSGLYQQFASRFGWGDGMNYPDNVDSVAALFTQLTGIPVEPKISGHNEYRVPGDQDDIPLDQIPNGDVEVELRWQTLGRLVRLEG